MPRSKIGACAAILLLLLPATVFGADVGATPQQKAYLASVDHQRESIERLRGIAPAVFPNCLSVNYGSDSLTVTQALAFDKNGGPRAGAWKETYSGTGCERTRKLNLFWSVDDKGKLNADYGVPGTTIAPMPAQKVAIAQAVQAAAARYTNCPGGSIDDTRFDMVLMLSSTPPEPPITSSWHEIWMVAACGHLVDVPLVFAQSGEALKITAEPAKITDHK